MCTNLCIHGFTCIYMNKHTHTHTHTHPKYILALEKELIEKIRQNMKK